MTQVSAIVVTYNRSEKLIKTIKSLLNQTIDIDLLIINNCSTDDTIEKCQEFISNDRFNLINLDENLGGAGGFSYGIEYAYSKGYKYLWVMDDDTYPETDAGEELVNTFSNIKEKHGHDIGYACSNVLWKDGNICEMNSATPKWDWHRFHSEESQYISILSTSFVSVMFHRNSIEQFGLPLKEYFIWYDDCEFTKRIGNKMLCIQNLNSKVIHDLPENQGVNFSFVNESNIWKYSYGARNESSYHIHHGKIQDFIAFFRYIKRGLKKGKIKKQLKLKIYISILSGFFFNPKTQFPK